MGANDKVTATYHGGEYTPSVNDLAGKCINDDNSIRFTPEMFDRSIAKIRAEAKAEAYKDAERIFHEEARWQLDLHQRHKEYRFKHCSERMTEMENCMTVRANQYKENQ